MFQRLIQMANNLRQISAICERGKEAAQIGRGRERETGRQTGKQRKSEGEKTF